MAASIESRVPFLDHVLVEFATRIPREVQIQGLTGKRILKKAMEDLLPHRILYRPKVGLPDPVERLAGRTASRNDSRAATRATQPGSRILPARSD